MVNQEKIEKALDRWVEKIYPSRKELLEVLRSGKKLSFYIGIDPTGPDMHLGHSTNYLLMRELQKAGHKIILLIGDFTARIGDPSGKAKARKPLTPEQIKENMKTYKQQAGKILELESAKNPVETKFNSNWLSQLTLEEVLKLMAQVTLQQLIKRSMFQKRMEEGKELRMHEVIYPLLQGYDSVAMEIDAEIGGTDQTFNMLVGRDLVKTYIGKEKFVLATPLLENPKKEGKLMSKSKGTYIGLNDSPNDIYGKTMALPDEVIVQIFKLCTRVPMQNIKDYKQKMDRGANPMLFKKRLAREIVTMYHGEKAARQAQQEFKRVFEQGKRPKQIKEVEIEKGEMRVVDLLVETGICSSKNEGKRMVRQGAVRIEGKRINNWREKVDIKEGMVVRVGKRRFRRVVH